MMTVRELVYALVSNDAELGTLDLNADTVFAGQAPDSPPAAPGRTFAVLNWGPEGTGPVGARGRGRPSERDCSLWVYTRHDDMADVSQAIKRWCALMDALEAVPTGDGPEDGWVISTVWQGDSADGWDDVYRANYRSSTYTIIASGD
jgi:hypothetical protein